MARTARAQRARRRAGGRRGAARAGGQHPRLPRARQPQGRGAANSKLRCVRVAGASSVCVRALSTRCAHALLRRCLAGGSCGLWRGGNVDRGGSGSCAATARRLLTAAAAPMFTGDDLIDDVLNKRFGNGYAFYGERQSDQQKDYSAIAEEAKQIVAMREVRRALRAASPARLPGILQLPPPFRARPAHPPHR